MKGRPLWIALLTAALLLACALPTPIGQATPEPSPTSTPESTQTATPTVSPTASPTPPPTETVPTATPAPTSTATPDASTPTPERADNPFGDDLSGVQMRVEDVPPGFMPFDLRMLGMPGFETFVKDEDAIENYASLVSMFPLEVAISFLTRAESQEEQEQLEAYLNEPELMLDQMASQTDELQEQEVLAGVPQLGDQSTGLGVAFTTGEQNLQFEMVAFRRRNVAVFVIDTHLYGADPIVSVYDIAALLDQRLQAALESAAQ